MSPASYTGESLTPVCSELVSGIEVNLDEFLNCEVLTEDASTFIAYIDGLYESEAADLSEILSVNPDYYMTVSPATDYPRD